MVTIKEIASASGVSRGTVDRVLNNRPGVSPETEALVRKTAEALGYQPDRTGQMLAARKRQLRLAFIIAYGEEFLFFRDVLNAAREKAASLEKVGLNVEFYLVEAFDRPYLEELLNRVLDSRPDGIAALPLRTAPFMEFMEKVNDRGIPTVFFNLDEDFADHLCYVGCDYHRSGRVAAGLSALCAGEKGEVAVLTHGKTVAPSYEARMEGFTRELAERYPGMTLVNGGRPTVFHRGDDPGIAALLEEYPNLKTLYIVNMGDFSVCRETRRMAGSRRLSIITNDLVPIQRQLLHDGTITATVSQQPEVQGAQPLQILYEYLVFGIEPKGGIHHTALEIILPQNCDL